MEKHYHNTEPVITIDIDWDPDYMILYCLEKLVAARVKATWFITHDTPALDGIRQYPDLFELGIHPNFCPGSTQGKTEEEIINFCLRLVPEAVSMRTHSLYQSSYLLAKIAELTPIETDVSLLLREFPFPRQVEWYTKPGRKLRRLVYVWEDDLEFNFPSPNFSWERLLAKIQAPYAICDFHPVHVYLNSCNMESYQKIKAGCSDLTKAPSSVIKSYVNRERAGTGNMFLDCIETLSRKSQGKTIKELRF